MATLINIYGIPVYATTLDQSAVIQKQQEDEALKQAQATQASISLLQNEAIQQVQSIQSSVSLIQNAIEQDNVAIQQHQKNLVDLDGQQKKLVIQQEEDIKALGGYLSMEYIQGDSPYMNYLECLVESKDFGDLLNRTVYIGSVIDFYQELKRKIDANTQELTLKQQTEQEETIQLTQIVQAKQQLEEGLVSALAKQKGFIDSLSDEERLMVMNLDPSQISIKDNASLMAAQDRLTELAAEIKSQQTQSMLAGANGKFTVPLQLDGQFGQLFAYAGTFLGLPYVFGGNSPVTGFDCSSYVQHVYAKFGVNLNRVTWDQYGEGTGVAPEDLKLGDLVFFTTYAPGPSHVGIYVGNRMMLDSSNGGVGYDSLDNPYWAARYYGARRVAL